MDVASILIATVMLLSMLGSCFPQTPSAAETNHEIQERWEKDLSARFSGFTDLLIDVGVFQFFHSPYFTAVVYLLGISALLCTLNRWRAAWRQAFHQPVKCPASIFEVARQTASFTFHPIPDLPIVARQILERHGLSAVFEQVGDSCYLRADRNRLSSLASLVTHTGVLLLFLGATLSWSFGWKRTIQLGNESTVGLSTEALLLEKGGLVMRFEGFEIERSTNGNVENYRAQITLSGPDLAPRSFNIRLNQPMKYNQVSVFLKDYQNTPTETSITLLEVFDPGYWLVVLSGFLILTGMTLGFNFPHSCIFIRVRESKYLQLAGQAKRQAINFGREFAAIVKDFQEQACQPAEGAKQTT
jgi:cytochrome c biogenesis protein ResB